MRLIYLGTPRFAVPTLEAILRANHEVIEVITQPDRPKGRGGVLATSPVKECALVHSLPIFQPERIRRPDAIEHLRDLAPEIMVVVGYGQILPQAVIDIAPRGILNVHASLLPDLRGAAPIQWSIIRGHQVTGVTTMQINAGLDTGPTLFKAETAIAPDEDAVALSERLAHMGADLLVETLEGLAKGLATPQAQDDSAATLAPILKKEDGRIDWSQPAPVVHNLVRGLQPWPGAHTLFRGNLMHIWLSRPVTPTHSAQPGTLTLTREGLFASTGSGTQLRLIEVQMEGRKRMSGEDFARGQRVTENERLGA